MPSAIDVEHKPHAAARRNNTFNDATQLDILRRAQPCSLRERSFISMKLGDFDHPFGSRITNEIESGGANDGRPGNHEVS